MTILITEMTHSGIVFAADRNHYNPKKGGHLELAFRAKKIFPIPYLQAGVGYFGGGRIGINKKTGKDIKTGQWLSDFINKNNDCQSLRDFSLKMSESLQKEILNQDRKEPYGFHIAGYQNGLPEFWFVRNFDSWNGEDGFKGLNNPDKFRCDEQFITLRKTALLVKSGIFFRMSFQNGSIQLFYFFTKYIDDFLNKMPTFKGATEGFKPLKRIEDYAKIPRFKMETTKKIYETFFHKGRQPMGGKIDCFTISKDGEISEISKNVPPKKLFD